MYMQQEKFGQEFGIVKKINSILNKKKRIQQEMKKKNMK